MDPTKTGFKTSEFAASLGGVVAVGAVSLGIVSADQTDIFAQMVTDLVTGLVAVVAIAGIIIKYVEGRNELKSKLIDRGVLPEAPLVEETPPVEGVPAA